MAQSELTFKLRCKETAKSSMRTMSQLNDALKGEATIPFSSLIPIANIITAIVDKDKDAFERTSAEFKSFIDEKNKLLSLRNIPNIAEINFLEGFNAFVSYIYTGNPGKVETVNNRSEHKKNDSPKRRAPKLVNEAREKDEPVNKSTRRTQEDKVIDDVEDIQKMKPTRKSYRIDDGPKFNCSFNRCTQVFKSVCELATHAIDCVHKSDLVLVFRCSVCKRSFLSDKAVRSHIGHINNMNCSRATISIETEKKLSNESEEKNVKSINADRDSKSRHTSRIETSVKDDELVSQMAKCTFQGCTYSNKGNLDHLYHHVKCVHPDKTVIFTCLKCGEKRYSGKGMESHLSQTCINAQYECKISEKIDLAQVLTNPSNAWETALRKCPITGCKFTATAARRLSLHFKRAHSENMILFKCSKCDHSNENIQPVIAHCKKCTGSKPRVLVNEVNIAKKTSKERMTRHKSLPPPSMSKRNSKRLSLKNWSKKEMGVQDEDDMPVLEMIMLDDEEKECVRSDDNEEMVDVVSIDDVEIKEENGEICDISNYSIDL